MRMINRLGLAAFSAILIAISAAQAQTSSGIMAPGDAAVTAFSGVPEDQTSERINRDGPSLRVIDLPGGGPFGITNTSKHFTATARDIGQAFGVAIDNKRAPDIFAAATAAYGLAIYRPGHGRVRNGTPGAQYTPGQFGPSDQGGGPDSIWRIDGQSGQISLFANVTFNGIQNAPASLGALAFDAATQQLFVADRATGLIHRFSLDGQDRGVFDHGTDGRQAAHLQPVPFDPATLANIQSARFDAQDPRSWGFAPPMRRVYALAMHNGRLFYSVAANSQIWSVGIAGNGAFAGDARFETAVKALRPGAEISQIAFDGHGQMFAAERGAPTGAQDFVAAADGGQNRVFRFQPKQPNDPSPGFWHAPDDEYAIGMPPSFQNADGGVGLTCGRTVWSTGERLLDPGNARPGTFPAIDGLQGNDSNLVKPANMPPMQAWMVNYYDTQADPASRGHMGAIAIWNVCGGAPPPPPSGSGYIGFGCPPGTFAIDGTCLVAPLCPDATIWRNGYCIYPRCPDGFAPIRGECRRPPIFCHPGEVFVRDRCIPFGCPPGLARGSNGYCHCPDNLSYRAGQCVPPPCPRDAQRDRDGRCVPNCPPGDFARSNCPCPRDQQRNSDGRCVPNCQPGNNIQGNCPCPRDQQRNSDGRCVPNCQPGNNVQGNCPCPRDERRNSDGRCVKPSPSCPPGAIGDNCKPVEHHYCPRGEVRSDGHCHPIGHAQTLEPSQPKCGYGERLVRGHCVSQNDDNSSKTTRVTKTGGDCGNGEVYRHGHCVSVDGSKGSVGLGCSRADYDRFGHCPNSGNDNGNDGSNHLHRRNHDFGSNGNGSEIGGQNDRSGGNHFHRTDFSDRGQGTNRDARDRYRPENTPGYGH